MPQYTVYYVIKDWLEVKVNAENEEQARKISKKKMDDVTYKDKAIDTVDGTTEFAGIVLNDVTDQIN